MFIRPSRPLSPVPQFSSDDDDTEKQYITHCKEQKSHTKPRQSYTPDIKSPSMVTSNINVSFTRIGISNMLEQPDIISDLNSADDLYSTINDSEKKNDSNDDSEGLKDVNYDIIGDVNIMTNLTLISQLNLAACGTPLRIFTEVSFYIFCIIRLLLQF